MPCPCAAIFSRPKLQHHLLFQVWLVWLYKQMKQRQTVRVDIKCQTPGSVSMHWHGANIETVMVTSIEQTNVQVHCVLSHNIFGPLRQERFALTGSNRCFLAFLRAIIVGSTAGCRTGRHAHRHCCLELRTTVHDLGFLFLLGLPLVVRLGNIPER